MRKTDTEIDVHAPLLAFERVCRRTGAIRRTCLFRNSSGAPRDLNIRYAFKEHSWVRFFSLESGGAESHETLSLAPGDNRIQVVLNTDSSNFPYDQFRGRVYFEEDGEPILSPTSRLAGKASWLEISFEEIDELRDFQGYAAIDLGTCNSMLSLYHLKNDAVSGMPWSPALEHDSVEVPSAVFIRDLARFRRLADGSCSIGRAALADYRASENNDPRSLQLSAKRLIGTSKLMVADGQGAGGAVDPKDILYMLGRAIRERAQQHDDVKARLPRLIVTFPPTWDHRQVGRWKQIFTQLGFDESDIDLTLDEASAAGLFYIYKWVRDSDSRQRLVQDLTHSWRQVTESAGTGDQYTLKLLSFDFGGGTIDLAYINVEMVLFDDVIRLAISLDGSDSLKYGGDQVTLAIFKALKRRIAMALSDGARFVGEDSSSTPDPAEVARASVESGLFLLPGDTRFFGPSRVKDAKESARQLIAERWDGLESRITAQELPRDLEDAVNSLVPTRFWASPEEPLSASAKRNFSWLWDRAEGLKRELFQEANRRAREVCLSADDCEDIRGGILLSELPAEIGDIGNSRLAEASVSVTIREVYRAISNPIEQAVLRARQLIGDERVDRVVLSGQSSWIPLVRRLFMQPRGEGGFGLPPSKIEFDRDNAKAAVCKGACLLPIMREALVGFEVDVSNFKANLLSEIYYERPLGGAQRLFDAGPIDDLRYTEDRPDPRSFAQHLTLLTGSSGQLLGQFDFTAAGEALESFADCAQASAARLDLPHGFPEYSRLSLLASQDAALLTRIVNQLRDWPERALVSWMEEEAELGSAEQPIYRYYLTRNRNLLAVVDRGAGDKRLYKIDVDTHGGERVHPKDNPFSGVH